MRARLVSLLAIVAIVPLLSCAAPRTAPPTLPSGPPTLAGAQPPSLRLPSTVKPRHHRVELTLDPNQESFTGAIDLDVELTAPTDVVWLNAEELTVDAAHAEVAGARLPARVLPQPHDFVGLAFERALPTGRARLHLTWRGKLSTLDAGGAVRQKEGEDWAIYTHFEPIDARRVFPCFDEPSAKAPWELSLVVPTGLRALANTPEVSATDLGDGKTRVAFAPSRPLPSYLVAFAVGAFELVDAGKTPRSSVPVRIVTPRGQAAQARWAAQVTATLLDRLEEYFGTPYPYEKVDCIAVPLFGGAMENPGLITFSSSLILRRPEEETVASRRAYAQVAIHELAHQWFGDLVTMAWWDDLWLNEAFATWMTPKIVEVWQPSWAAPEGRVGARATAMHADSLTSARRIRQPIASNHDMKNAFDAITYQKGASVLHMFERYLGPEVFQRGVRRYLAAHAHGNATAAEFLDALSKEAPRRQVEAPFASFLDQPGVPLITVEARCDKASPPRLRLKQTRYLPLGSTGQPGTQRWRVPVCVRAAAGKVASSACGLVEDSEVELPLELPAGSCPSWVLPNDGGAGYYSAALPVDGFRRLLTDPSASLSVPEKLAVIHDLQAAVRAGLVRYADVLPLVPALAKDPNRHIVQAAAGLVWGLRDGELVPEAARPAYAKFIRDAFGPRARALGWLPKRGEDEDTRLLRNTIVPLVADQGEDTALGAEAQRLARAWLDDHRAVDAEAVELVLEAAAQRGDRALHDRLVAAARAERDRLTRRRLLAALGAFRDPALVQANFALALDPAFDLREAYPLLGGATRTPKTRAPLWNFVKQQVDAIVARMPRDFGARLPSLAVGQCSDAARSEVEAFFAPRAAAWSGGPRLLAQALEEMRLCAAYRETQGPSVAAFFGSARR
jgi:alanyl aminopeptidase